MALSFKAASRRYGSPLLKECMGKDKFEKYILARMRIHRQTADLIREFEHADSLLGVSDSEENRSQEIQHIIKRLKGL